MKVKVFLKKNGTFSSQHIHDNAAMKERGIDCVKEQDRQMRMENKGVTEKSIKH